MTDAEIARVLRWIEQHGDLVGYPCPDGWMVTLLFHEMKGRRLIRWRGYGFRKSYALTDAGRVLMRSRLSAPTT